MLNTTHIAILIITFISIVNDVYAQDKVSIATLEWSPFISSHQPSHGYTIEVISEAFARVDYNVDIEFVTLARGMNLLEKGGIDGYITSFGQKNRSEEYVLSSDFPGDTIGFLKKKTLDNSIINSTSTSMDDYIHYFNEYKFGIVKGDISTEQFNSLPRTSLVFSVNDSENISNLAKGVVDFIVIGKYSAANIITNKNPNLIGQFNFIQPSDSPNTFNIAFSKKTINYQKIKNDFNKGLEAIKQDSFIANLSKKYGFYSDKVDAKRLTIGIVNNNDMLQLQSLSEAFEKLHSDIKIDWRIMDENILRERLLSDLAISDGQYDVMMIGIQEIAFWSQKSWLSPITNLPKNYALTDLFESLRESHSYQGELYALPFYAESSVTYYRKDLFSKAGIKMSSQPTYSEILKHSKAIHNPENEVYGLCLRGKAGWGENMALFTTMVNTYGGKWFNKDWHPQINTNAWKKALHSYKDMMTNYGPPNPEKNGYNENLNLFLNGKCGIWIDATIAASSIFNKDKSIVSDNVAIVKSPIAVTPIGSSWLWAWSLAIPASSNNKGIAQDFITWATSKDYINLAAKKEGWKMIPQGTRKSVYNNRDYLAVAPYSQIILESITNANKQSAVQKDRPYSGIQFVEIAEFHAIGNHVGKLISDVIKGTLTVDIALKKAQNYTKSQMILSEQYKDSNL